MDRERLPQKQKQKQNELWEQRVSMIKKKVQEGGRKFAVPQQQYICHQLQTVGRVMKRRLEDGRRRKMRGLLSNFVKDRESVVHCLNTAEPLSAAAWSL